MTLEHPATLLLLLLLPILILVAWRQGLGRTKQWEQLLVPRLRTKFVRGSSPHRHWVSLCLALCGLALFIVALARPVAGYTEDSQNLRGRNILMAIDVSRSMLVKDVSPDRLKFAKVAAMEIVNAFPNDRIGLMAFAGSAFLQAPLTYDHSALRETITQLDASSIPAGGSDLRMIFKEALSVFRQTGQTSHALLLLSDGEHHGEDFQDLAQEASELGVTILPIGIGTSDGGFVPDPEQRDGRFRDKKGNPVISRLDEPSLRKMANLTGGTYLNGISANLTSHIDKALNDLEEYRYGERKRRIANPRYQWFILPGMLLLLASLLTRQIWSNPRHPALPGAARPGVTTTLCLLLLCSGTEQNQASPFAPYQARRALTEGNYEQAEELYTELLREAKSPKEAAKYYLGLGMAQTKNQDATEAARSLARALVSPSHDVQAPAQFNLAGNLYEQGKKALEAQDLQNAVASLEDASSHLEDLLAEEGDYPGAKANLKVIKEQLDKLKQQQQNGDQQEQEDESSQPKNQDEQSQQEQNNSNEQDDQENENQHGQESPSDSENQQNEPSQQEDPSQDDQQEEDNTGEHEQQERQKQQEKKQTPQPTQEQNGSQQGEPQQETPEDKAYRLLETFADFQNQPPLKRRAFPRKPEKDW